MTEQVIRQAASLFAEELAKYAIKLDIATYDHPSFTLTVNYSKEKGPRLEVQFDSNKYGSEAVHVKGTRVGVIMDEVYRRSGFNDKAEMSMDQESASLRALTHTPETFES